MLSKLATVSNETKNLENMKIFTTGNTNTKREFRESNLM